MAAGSSRAGGDLFPRSERTAPCGCRSRSPIAFGRSGLGMRTVAVAPITSGYRRSVSENQTPGARARDLPGRDASHESFGPIVSGWGELAVE